MSDLLLLHDYILSGSQHNHIYQPMDLGQQLHTLTMEVSVCLSCLCMYVCVCHVSCVRFCVCVFPCACFFVWMCVCVCFCAWPCVCVFCTCVS